MKRASLTPDDLRGVFAVPPLARRAEPGRRIDFDESDRLVQHMSAGGLTRFLYGGNAFLYHVTLEEYEELLRWLSSFADGQWAIPSVGPSFGRAMDQAALLRRHRFPCAMALPCGDPRDAAGLEAGLREIAETAGLGHGIFRAGGAGDWTAAEALRARFIPLEDKRDAWGPARVLHAALDLAGVARTGPIPPFVSPLGEAPRTELAPVARALLAQE